MTDLQERLERALERATRMTGLSDDLERFLRYRDRRRRNQRLAAGAVVLGVTLAIVGAALSVLRSSEPIRPAGFGTLVGMPAEQGPCRSSAHPCWDTDLFVVGIDGTGVARLEADRARDIAYSWSPDGSRIAFVHGEDPDHSDIDTINADGTDVRRLTDVPGLNLFPAFSPDGTKIAFTSDRSGTVEVYVMNTDGSHVVQLTESGAGGPDDYHPTWSPDGSRIAFMRGDVPPGGPGRLWVVNADGSNPHVLRHGPTAAFPSWSPDGTRIAFESGDWPAVRVQILDLQNGTVDDLGIGFHPVWSPDSARLAVSDPDGGFWILRPQAPQERVLLHATGWAAAWSPDGERIAFTDSADPAAASG